MRQRGYMSGPLQPPGPCQTLIAVQHFNDEIHRMSCALRLQPHGCQGPWQASISQCCKPAPARLPRSFPSTVMQAGTAELVYCDTPQTLFEAAAAIRQAGSAVVDCEGHELGDAQGRLTIIQVVPVSPQPVSYVVDVMKLQMQGAPALQPLLQLLADPTITKVMFDCRNDATALWHELDCKLQSVLDLQLLDLLVWESAASEQQRLQRLKGFMKSNPERTPFFYKSVYQMSGLRGSLISNKVNLTPEVAAHLDVKKNLQPGWSQAWLERPLDPKLLEYAVYDVLAILALYQHFEAAGWVNRMGAEVRAGSAAYAALYNMVRYERSNPYQNHSLLPFNVLTRLSPRPTGSQRFCGG